jgi:hypothetical protein
MFGWVPTRRLLQSSRTIFCGCGGLRLSREGSGAVSGGAGGEGGAGSFGLDLLRRRLEEAWVRNGTRALYTSPPTHSLYSLLT